jgi:hypothetical protein
MNTRKASPIYRGGLFGREQMTDRPETPRYRFQTLYLDKDRNSEGNLQWFDQDKAISSRIIGRGVFGYSAGNPEFQEDAAELLEDVPLLVELSKSVSASQKSLIIEDLVELGLRLDDISFMAVLCLEEFDPWYLEALLTYSEDLDENFSE